MASRKENEQIKLVHKVIEERVLESILGAIQVTDDNLVKSRKVLNLMAEDQDQDSEEDGRAQGSGI